MSKNLKLIITVVAVLILLGGAFFIYSSTSSTSDTAVTANSAPASDAELMFLNLSTQLDSISFDTTVLNDPRFKALVDIHTAILPETAGRKNPFAPIGASQ